LASYLYFYFVTSANTPLALQVTNYDPVVNANRQTDEQTGSLKGETEPWVSRESRG